MDYVNLTLEQLANMTLHQLAVLPLHSRSHIVYRVEASDVFKGSTACMLYRSGAREQNVFEGGAQADQIVT